MTAMRWNGEAFVKDDDSARVEGGAKVFERVRKCLDASAKPLLRERVKRRGKWRGSGSNSVSKLSNVYNSNVQ